MRTAKFSKCLYHVILPRNGRPLDCGFKMNFPLIAAASDGFDFLFDGLTFSRYHIPVTSRLSNNATEAFLPPAATRRLIHAAESRQFISRCLITGCRRL